MNHGNNVHSIVPASILVAVLATFQLASAQTTEPILRVAAGAHNGIIYENREIDPSNSILITGSEDKRRRSLGHLAEAGNSCLRYIPR